jgi:hypothetical protein
MSCVAPLSFRLDAVLDPAYHQPWIKHTPGGRSLDWAFTNVFYQTLSKL